MASLYAVQFYKRGGVFSGNKQAIALLLARDTRDAESIIRKMPGVASDTVKAWELRDVVVMFDGGSVVERPERISEAG